MMTMMPGDEGRKNAIPIGVGAHVASWRMEATSKNGERVTSWRMEVTTQKGRKCNMSIASQAMHAH